ncbi:DUF3108 domain-containing protein [Alishewanella tabrizica]|uniref:DUF3108 domain-containing protein n=1 Tax=Alishewanella tabrizica TaxID=671278 RepID=A0ABQ2WC27_9ALTE|nr:DUF3108 domain-containing protein [Alishewanella tabrizica]GGW49265.1 hypothetical protein GCM10008111_01240 [Alishewanella tabrizica]
MTQTWRVSAPQLLRTLFFRNVFLRPALVSKVLLCSVLFSAAAFAQPSPSSSVETAATPVAFSTFDAEYLVYRGGKSHGSAKRFLHKKDDIYEMGYSSDISWLVFSDKRSETSTFSFTNGQLRPLHYVMKRSGTGANRHYEFTLDWQNQQLFTGKKPQLKAITWQDNWLDPLSYHQQLVLDLKAGKTQFSYDVLNRDGNSKTYHYAVVAEEPLALPFGTVRALRIARVEENSDKQVLAWVAPSLDYMLVRLWRGEDNVEQFDVQLHKLTWLSHASEANRLAETE